MPAVLLVAFAAVFALALASLRWLRVAQREHYQPGRVSVFALRWWRSSPANLALGAGAAAASVAALVLPGALGYGAACAGLAVAAVAPLGLGLRGRTSPLRWTRRMRVLAVTSAALAAGSAAVATRGGSARWLGALALLAPPLIDAALALTGPLERLLNERFVRSARQVLARVDPLVVGITGSYGKTTVKNYAAHMLRGGRKTVASRASFNNRLGLARSVNEDLGLGTDVFLAEMGTYGPGEIRELCGWLRPKIGVITAIGPVHLERMRSIETILAAKTEIVDGAEVAVLNVDVDELCDLAGRLAGQGRRVVRCSARDDGADVLVRWCDDKLEVRAGDRCQLVAPPPIAFAPVNLALALGVALALDALPVHLEEVFATLPPVPNRMTVHRPDGGWTVIDDTYNANPAGARQALATLAAATDGNGGRSVVVTPGMIELGERQPAENRAFAARAATVATDVVVVGRTNRRDLMIALEGAPSTKTVVVSTRDEAVAWTRTHLSPGDAVLFENDLPDHYP